jgi:PhoU domain
MEIHQGIQTLRLYLLDMLRVSQRSFDHFIQADTSGCQESCRRVRNNTEEINILHREITETISELLWMGLPLESDLRSVTFCGRISDVLQAMHSQAGNIAENSMRLLENGGKPRCNDLAAMGSAVNSLLRSCVLTLFDEEVDQPEAILRWAGIERQTNPFDAHKSTNLKLSAQTSYEQAISNALTHIAEQIYEIAGAIVLWSASKDCGSMSEMSHQQIMYGTP